MFFLPWLLGALFIIVVAFFWFSKKTEIVRKNTEQTVSEVIIPNFTEEFSTELTIPVALPEPPREPELPHYYGIDRLALLARDPYWLYAYWEITATKQEEFSNAYGPGAWSSSLPVLRLYDVTGLEPGSQTSPYIDIGINEDADNWNIQVGKPDRSFFVDLGRRFADGRFVTLLRSNIVTTPRASLSDRTDEEWMWIEGIYRSYRYQFGLGSPMLADEMAQRAGELFLGGSSPGQWQKEIP